MQTQVARLFMGCLVWLWLVASVSAAVSYDTTSSSSCAGCNSLTITSHTVTCGTSNALMIVSIITSGEEQISAVTYNGLALTLKDASLGHETWFRIAPTTGSAQNIVITPTNTGVEMLAAATSFCGVDQTTPLGTVTINSGSTDGSPLTTTATVPTNGMALSNFFLYDSGGLATTVTVSGGTQRWQLKQPAYSLIHVGQTRTTTGSMGYAFNGGNGVQWRSVIMPINEAVAAPASPASMRRRF